MILLRVSYRHFRNNIQDLCLQYVEELLVKSLSTPPIKISKWRIHSTYKSLKTRVHQKGQIHPLINVKGCMKEIFDIWPNYNLCLTVTELTFIVIIVCFHFSYQWQIWNCQWTSSLWHIGNTELNKLIFDSIFSCGTCSTIWWMMIWIIIRLRMSQV